MILNKRHIFDEEDIRVLNKVKNEIVDAIQNLQSRNVRDVNIELELVWHIKKILKGE